MNTFQQRAHDTKARRQAAGRYMTPTQKALVAKIVSHGYAALTEAEQEIAKPVLSRMGIKF